MTNTALKQTAPGAAMPVISFSPQPMRGIKQAVEEIKAADPDTALTVNGLRALVNSGTVPCVRMGRKILINMNILNRYLNNGMAAAEEPYGVPQIRRIKE